MVIALTNIDRDTVLMGKRTFLLPVSLLITEGTVASLGLKMPSVLLAELFPQAFLMS
jgi:hypothetical protein